MTQIFESVTVTISKREYADLIQKAFAHDAFKRHLKERVASNYYISDIEKALFFKEGLEEQELEEQELPELLLFDRNDVKAVDCAEEEPEEEEGCISDEVWNEIEAMVDKEENDGTETV